jgi:hypothetical protein
MRMNAGTSIVRTIAASISTDAASPNPSCFISWIREIMNAAKIVAMINGLSCRVGGEVTVAVPRDRLLRAGFLAA